MASSNTKHIFQSLAVNVAIAVAKGAAAFFTGSGAMLAETLHSAADCSNQLLLLLGVKRSARAPDELHPLGYGRALYFYSFIVALLLFSGGGVFSIYEGAHKLLHPEPVERVGLGLGILLFSLVLEGWATWGNLKELKARRGATPLFRYLRDTKDSDLVVVFGENSAAVLGLAFALGALSLAHVTGDARWDAAGSLSIGVVLVGVAVFLGVEVKSLLIGERADPSIDAAVREELGRHPAVQALLRLITVQQGPGEVLVAMKVRLTPGLSGAEVVATINAYERALKARRPEIRWCFVEPDEHA
ncbi:MAG: cation diffusion facilitator family transporter [Myxococcota bacterium]